MKIEVKRVEKMTLEEFADKYGLVMQIVEQYNAISTEFRFRANFKGVKIKDNVSNKEITCVGGYGRDEETAMKDYGNLISGKILVFNGLGFFRKDISIPKIVG